MSANLEIQLVCSPIGCPPNQRQTVRGLGLRKLQAKRLVVDTPQIRGMIATVPHLVKILGERATKPTAKKRVTKKKTTGARTKGGKA